MKDVPQIVVSGSIAVDRIMNFGGHFADLIKFEKMHSLSISVLLDKLQDTHGGIGANIAYNLALLGNKPVLLGAVGASAKGYVADLGAMGVDVSHVHESQLPTASFNVITDGGNRQVGGFYPGAMSDSASLTFALWAGQNALFVVAPHDPDGMRRQVEECRNNKLRLFYDVSQQVSNISGDDIKAGVEAAELLILNDYELSVMSQKTGMTAEEIKAKVPVVIVTLGSDGSVIEGKNQPTAIAVGVVTPAKVDDPTGAGDAYRAGFLHGYVRGWELKTAAQLGAACAAYAIEKPGTQNHHFTLTEAAERYRQAFNEDLPAEV